MIVNELLESLKLENQRNVEAKKTEMFGDPSRRREVIKRARQAIEALKIFTSDELALLWPESCGRYDEDWSGTNDHVFFDCPIVEGLRIQVQFEGRTFELYTDHEEDFGIWIQSDVTDRMHYLVGQVDRAEVVAMIADTLAYQEQAS